MTGKSKPSNVYDLHAQTRRHHEFHTPDCRCPICSSFEPAVQPVRSALTFIDLGMIAWAGIGVASAIAFAIDPHGAWHALASCFGSR